MHQMSGDHLFCNIKCRDVVDLQPQVKPMVNEMAAVLDVVEWNDC